MRRSLHILVLLAIGMLSLADSVVAQVQPEVNTLTITRCAHVPVIDGVIAPEEWDSTARVSDFSVWGILSKAKEQTDVMATFDSANLYIAFRCAHPYRKIRALAVKRDDAVYTDDAVELFIQPDLAKPEYYQFAGNSKGVFMDGMAKDTSWNGPWVYKASVHDGYWEGEISISIVALGIDAPHDGLAIGFNAGRDQQTVTDLPEFVAGGPSGIISSWAPVRSSFHNPKEFGRLILAGGSPVVRMIAKSEGRAPKAVVSAELRNPARSERKIHASYLVYQDGKEIDRRSADLSLKPGDAAPVDFAFDLPFGDYTTVFRVEESTPSGTGPLVSQTIRHPFKSPLKLKKYLLSGSVEPIVDMTGALDGDGWTAEFALLGGGRKLAAKRVSIDKSDARVSAEFDIAKLKPGVYKVEASVRNLAGRTAFSGSESFQKPQPPVWLNSKIGISDEVLPPWKPMKARARSVSCWGREYRFDALPFPAQIVNQGVKMLAGPISLMATSGGRAVSWSPRSFRLTKRSDAKVVASSRSSSGAMTLSGTAAVEYDGMARIDLSVSSTKPVDLGSLTLDIPLTKEAASLIVAETTTAYGQDCWPYWAGCRNGDVPKQRVAGPFTPYVWLGNNHRGLVWFAECPKGWSNKDEKKVIEILPESDRVVLRVRFVDDPIRLDKPLDLTFGLQATPVKRASPRKRICVTGNYGLEKRTVRKEDVGRITYPGAGNVNLERGTLHIWARPNFDPDVTILADRERAYYNENLFSLDIGEDQTLGFYWNIDNRGMVGFVKKGSQFPVIVGTGPLGWKKGEDHLLTMTWGDRFRIFIDGRLRASSDYKGSLNRTTAKSPITLHGNFTVDAMRIDDTQYMEGEPVAQTAGEHTLFMDTFSRVANGRTRPEKIGSNLSDASDKSDRTDTAGASGKLIGAVDTGGGRAAFHTRDVSRSTLDDWKKAGFDIVHIHDHWTESEGYPKTERHKAELKSLVKGMHQAGMKQMVYLGFQLGDNSPEFKAYKDDLVVEPWVEGQGWKRDDHIGYNCSYTGQYANFMLYNLEELIEGYDIDALYMDGTFIPPADMNTHHGAGYIDRKGRLMPSQQIFAYREWIKRIRTMANKLKPGFWIDMHDSAAIWTPTNSFGDSIYTGEQYAALSERYDGTIRQCIPLDTFRAAMMGTQYGFPFDMLDYYDMPNAQALAGIHGIPVRQQDPRIEKIRDDFGVNSAEWFPYYENARYVTTSDPDVKASFFRRKDGQILLVLANFGKAKSEPSIALNAPQLRLPRSMRASDLLECTDLTVEDGRFTIPLEPWRIHFVLLNPRR